MLPLELLQHVLSFIGDPLCFSTIKINSSHRQRYQYELAHGHKEIETKRALLLTSRLCHAAAIESAWSWVTIMSMERLLFIESLLREGDSSLTKFRNTHEPLRTDKTARRPRLEYWIRRLDVNLTLNPEDYTEAGPVIQALAFILTNCINLEVFVSDISVSSIDCQRISPLIRNSLKNLPKLRRLDFAGHEGPSLVDYIEMVQHLGSLEQLVTGRIADPRLGQEEIAKVVETKMRSSGDDAIGLEEDTIPTLSLPSIRCIQLSHRPLHSFLRLVVQMQLPSLTHVSIRHLDFPEPRISSFISAIGKQLTHIYTNDIRTSESPFGYARILLLCPNLRHLSFAPRLRDDRHAVPWDHGKLETIALRTVLPSTIPDQDELTNNINRSVEQFIERLAKGHLNGGLPLLTSITIEDEGHAAMELERRYGKRWDDICDQAGIELLGYDGYRIPSGVPTEEPKHSPNADKSIIDRKGKMKRLFKELQETVASGVHSIRLT